MSNISPSNIPTLLKLFFFLSDEECRELVITIETSFRRARANFWKLKAELQARRKQPFPIGTLITDNLFAIRSHAQMKDWAPEQSSDAIDGIRREWEKMNADHERVVKDLGEAREIQLVPEQMEESSLMSYLYWERAIDYKYNMPWLNTRDELMQQYVRERLKEWREGEVETWS